MARKGGNPLKLASKPVSYVAKSAKRVVTKTCLKCFFAAVIVAVAVWGTMFLYKKYVAKKEKFFTAPEEEVESEQQLSEEEIEEPVEEFSSCGCGK